MLVTLAACTPVHPGVTAASTPTGIPVARAQLAALVVADPVDTPYARTDDFGRAWSVDVDHNGCDTRNDVLRRDLTDVSPASGCTVQSGVLADPYTGRTIQFRRGRGTSSAVQIDHVYPLHDAWEHGAASWTRDRREHYANDPAVVLAVSGPANESKGDRGPGAWRPPRQAEWCDYARRYVRIATAYGLSVTSSDRVALGQMLDTCPARTP